MWKQHDNYMKQLQQLYNKTSKQTQNRLQEIFDTFNFTTENIYNIADSKTKKRINTYIEQWKEQGLLKNNNYFTSLANNIYRRIRVKNSEILELLIYSAYIEEQSKLEKPEKQIMYEDANYYYQEGIKEVDKKKKSSVIPMALFLALLDQPNYSGINWNQYIEATMQYNAQQIYKQTILNIQQQKNLEIDSSEFQTIINRQNNQKLNINNDKISGATDLQMIGLNNLAKVEGIRSNANDNAQVEFWAVTDEHSTEMCQSMNMMRFYINKENKFDRYWGNSKKDIKLMPVRVKGLVPGINLPPIMYYWHWCRSTIRYVSPVEKQEKTEYNNVDYIRKNNYTNSKNLDSNIKKAIKRLPRKIQKIINDTTFEVSKNNSYYDRKNNIIHLLNDSNEYEILHEIGHVIETKLDLLHDKKYIEIQQNGLNIKEIHTDNIKGYGKENEFWLDGNKFISEYQRRVYEQDIDGNYKLNYLDFTFNPKTLGEYFSEGFRCYFEENKLLKRRDINLYNYIKEVLK